MQNAFCAAWWCCLGWQWGVLCMYVSQWNMAVSIAAYRASIGLFNHCIKDNLNIAPCSPLFDVNHEFYRKNEWQTLMDRNLKQHKSLYALSLCRCLIAISLLIICVCSLISKYSLVLNPQVKMHILACICVYAVLKRPLYRRLSYVIYAYLFKSVIKPPCVLIKVSLCYAFCHYFLIACCSEHMCFLALLLLKLSNDIESNPGP